MKCLNRMCGQELVVDEEYDPDTGEGFVQFFCEEGCGAVYTVETIEAVYPPEEDRSPRYVPAPYGNVPVIGTTYDEAFGFVTHENAENADDWHYMVTHRRWHEVECRGCGKMKTLPENYDLCNSCAERLELGMDLG